MEKRDVLSIADEKSSQSAAQTLSLTPMIRAAVPFALMRRVLLLSQERVLLRCDTSNPNAEVARKAMGSVSRRFVRLFAYVGRIRGE
jgi:hypothetical protein